LCINEAQRTSPRANCLEFKSDELLNDVFRGRTEGGTLERPVCDTPVGLPWQLHGFNRIGPSKVLPADPEAAAMVYRLLCCCLLSRQGHISIYYFPRPLYVRAVEVLITRDDATTRAWRSRSASPYIRAWKVIHTDICDARPGSSNFRKLLLRAKTASPNFETEASSSGYQQVRRQLQFDSAYCSFHRCMKFETTSDVRIVDIKHCLLELLRIASHDYSGLLKSANAMLEDEVGRRRALTSL